jgi:hypothetical protein
MEQLTYISTFGLEVGTTDVEDVLAVSRRNNRRDGITGILIADGTRFLQVLEGNPTSLNAAFARISADPRHFAIYAIARKSIDNRQFGEWDMAYQQVDGVADELSLARRIETMIGGMPEGEVKTRLRHFIQLDRQTL